VVAVDKIAERCKQATESLQAAIGHTLPRSTPPCAFLAGRAFDAQAVNAMSLAFGGACDALGLHPTAKDPATSLVAEKVIELAMTGVHDAQALRTMTLREFSQNSAQAPKRTSPQRMILLSHLAMAERHIAAGERHVARQREIVAELEAHGHSGSQTLKVAREVLQSFETAQTTHLADRERLKHALGA
jgi:hypothetical protein